MTATIIQLKKSATPSAQPTTLANGELAINYADGKIFYKDILGSIQQISSGSNSYSTINVAGSLILADMPSDVLTINKGDNIEISTDILNDSFTITANLKPAFDKANLAWELANTANTKTSGASVTTSNTSPLSPTAGDLWWDTDTGRLFVYYTDTDSSQWVEASPSGGVVDYVALAANVVTGLVGSANTETVAVSYIIDSFPASQYRTAKYIIQGVSSSNVHSTEVLLTHNGSNVFITEYATIFTGNSELYTVSANLYSSNVNLIINSANANTIIDFYRFKLAAR